MAKFTQNYNLEKPDKTDFYDVEVMNSNLDKIDVGLAQFDGLDGKYAKLNAQGKVVDGKGNEVVGQVTSVNGQIGDVAITLPDTAALQGQVTEIGTTVSDLSSQLAQTEQQVTELNNKKLDKNGSISVSQIDKNKGKLDQTYLSDELLQQMAGNTPINAIPADKSITNNKLADKAVDIENVSFTVNNPKNLFNGDYLYDVATFMGDGTTPWSLVSSVNGVVAVIPVVGGKVYYVKKFSVSDRFRIVGTINEPNFKNGVVDYVYYSYDGGAIVTVETQNDVNYLVIHVSSSSQTPRLQVTESDIASYQPPKLLNKSFLDVTPSPVKLLGKPNLLNFDFINKKIEVTGWLAAINNKENLLIKEQVLDISAQLDAGNPNRSMALLVDTNGILSYMIQDEYNPNTHSDKFLIGSFSVGLMSVSGVDSEYMINGKTISENQETWQSKKRWALGNPRIYESPTALDPSGYTTSQVLSIYDGLTSPLLTKNALGTDALGNTLYEYVVDKPSAPYIQYANETATEKAYPYQRDKIKILINSGTHGDEKGSAVGLALFIKDLLANTTSEELRFIRDNATLKIIPVLNPSGFNANTRNNHNNINLNRDFVDFSQKETQIAKAWVENNKDAIALLDYHNTVGAVSLWTPPNDTEYHELCFNLLSNLEHIWSQRLQVSPPYGALYTEDVPTNMAAYGRREGFFSTTVEASRHSSATKGTPAFTFDDLAVQMANEVLGNLIISLIKRVS